MIPINSIGLEANSITNTQTKAAQSTAVATQNATTNTLTDKTTNSDKVEISTRAQKVQALNKEFFSGGPGSVVITPEFVQRLEQYGFLTAEQAKDLGADAVSTSDITVAEVSKFIDVFSDKITKNDPENKTLLDALQQAKKVLDNFNSPTADSKNINIAQVSQQLKTYAATDEAQLSDEDKQALKELSFALDIAEVLTPGKNTTAEIDRYLDIRY